MVSRSVLVCNLVCAILLFFPGLVVPDVPLEETEILRKEALKYKIELVCPTLKTS